MKIFIILCYVLFYGIALAKDVPIVAYETIRSENGKYHYHYELADGSKASQDGVLKHISADNDGEAVEGKFSYIADDGVEYVLNYTADENGYRPVGLHLPTPPPIPESVLKTLRYIEEHPHESSQDSSVQIKNSHKKNH